MSNPDTNTLKAIKEDSNSSDLPTICIDLQAVHAQAELEEKDLIQKHVYVTLKNRIAKRLEWIQKNKESNQNQCKTEQSTPSGSGWVSFIDGTRGAGKSTFLYTTLRLIGKDDNFKKLVIVGCIDPSRIESNEIVLLALLHALKEKVEEALKLTRHCEEGLAARKRWQKAFHKVAGGLVMFQPDHHPLKELDEELFLDIGLERAGHSAKLRNNLSQLFDEACTLLKVDALLFAFDDADTNSKHAIALLEVIRNYLDTPRLLILLTGDLELYSLLVRQNFRDELTQDKPSEWGSPGAANDRSLQQSRMLNHLEEQYLLKIFPVQERHILFPLWRLADEMGSPTDGTNKYEVKGKSGSLIDFVKGHIQKGFRLTTSSDIDLFTEFFLMQPLRSVLQTLARIESVTESSEYEYAREFSQAMIAMSLQNLYQANIPVDELVAENFHALTETVFDIAMADGDPDTSTYLRPTSADVHNRSAMFGLSAAVAHQLRGKPGTCLTYLLRGPGMVKLMHDAIDSTKRAISEDVLNREFRRYMGPGRKEDALGWSRLASAALIGEYTSNPPNRLIRYGTIGLNQNGSNLLTSFKTAFRTIGNQGNEGSPYPAAAFSLVNLSGSGTKTLASIYNILGLMAKLLALTEKSSWSTSNEVQKEQDILDLLFGFFPNTNSVALPVWVKSQGVGSESDDEDTNPATYEKESIRAWVVPLRQWLVESVKLNEHMAPSSVLIGKILPRLFYGLENISDSLRGDSGTYKRDFASAMELFALCVVNAFLAEESAFHLTTKIVPKRIFLANPRTSAFDYIKRMHKAITESTPSPDRLPLTYIVASCPLITGLISKDKAVSGIQNWPFFSGSLEKSIFISSDDWKLLSKISIAGKKSIQSNKLLVQKKKISSALQGDSSEEFDI